MVKILEKELEEIVIMGRNQFQTPEDLARFVSIEGRGEQQVLYWASGVVFTYDPVPASGETVADLIKKKRVYWTMVSYAFMLDYRPLVETKEKIVVPVQNMNMSRNFRKVCEWLKGLR